MMNEISNACDRKMEATMSGFRNPPDTLPNYAIYMLDAGGYVMSLSKGVPTFTSCNENATIGEHFSSFYRPTERAEGLPEIDLQTAAIMGRCESEGWRLNKDQTVYWAQVVIEPSFDDSHELAGFAAIARNLTTKNMKLPRSETGPPSVHAQLNFTGQDMRDYAIHLLDMDGSVTTWNSGAECMTGYAADKIIGQNLSLFFTSNDRTCGEHQRALETAARDGRFKEEGWQVREDGTQFRAIVIIDAIRDNSGALVRFAKVTYDVTETTATQRALDRMESELFQSAKIEDVRHLSSDFAHDFNNLLMVMLASLQMLEKHVPPSPAITELFNNARESGKRSTALIQRLVAVSKPDEDIFEPSDGYQLLDSMTSLIGRSLGPGMKFESRIEPFLPKMRGDAKQLSSVLLEVFLNARDSMPKGGSLSVSGGEFRVGEGERMGLSGGNYVCLSIRSTAAQSDELKHSDGQQIVVTKADKGTDHGLFTAANVLERLGGKLILRANFELGAILEVWLPLYGPEQDGCVVPEPVMSSKTIRILAVDDDTLVLRNTELMLTDMGHVVSVATSGEQALLLIEREPAFDLVLTDYAMPSMSGSQLADIAWETDPSLPIIVASGYARLPFGANPALPLISRPFSSSQLSHIIDINLRKSYRASA